MTAPSEISHETRIDWYWWEKNYVDSLDAPGSGMTSTSMSGYWQLDGDLQDSSGYSQHLTGAGTITHHQTSCLTDFAEGRWPGKSNNDFVSANFASAKATATDDGTKFNATTGISVSAWVGPTSNSDITVVACHQNHWMLKQGWGIPTFDVWVGAGWTAAISSIGISPDEEYQLVGTYDATSGDVRIYVNGALGGTANTGGGNIPDPGAPSNVELGSYGAGYYWPGRISQVKLYKNRVLTPFEVKRDHWIGSNRICSPITGYNTASTAYFYWMASGIILSNDRLIMLCTEVHNEMAEGVGWSAFYCDDYSGTPDTWEWTECSVPAWHSDAGTDPYPVIEPFVDGSYLYAISVDRTLTAPDQNWLLARWPLASAEAGDLSSPTWWTGSTWSSDRTAADGLFPDDDTGIWGTIWTEGGTWYSISSYQPEGANGFQNTAVLRTAPALTGPWSSATTLVVPERFDVTADAQWYGYRAHVGIPVPGDGILVSWTEFPTLETPDIDAVRDEQGWVKFGIIRGYTGASPTFEEWDLASSKFRNLNGFGDYANAYCGGDGTDAIDLGDGRVCWVFGDSWVAIDANNPSRTTSFIPNGALAIQWPTTAVGPEDIRVVREKPPLREHITIEAPYGGAIHRWGEEDPNPEDCLSDLSYGDGQPGGFDQMSASLPRKSNIDYSDLEPFSNVQVRDAAGNINWEGRLERAPKVAGDEFHIDPDAVGWQAHLEDNKNAAEIFVDIDFSHFEGPSARIQVTAGTAYALKGPEMRPAPIGGTVYPPSLWTGFDSVQAYTIPVSIGMYDTGPFVNLGSVYYAWKRHTNTIVIPEFDWMIEADENDVFGGAETTGDLAATGPDSDTFTPIAANLRFVEPRFGLNEKAPPDEEFITADVGIFWTMLAIYGRHGLTKRGSGSYTTAPGFYASDIIEYVIDTWCPELSVGTIDDTTFVIPQLEFRTPTTPAEMVKQANRFHLFDWFIGPGKKFHYRQRGTYGRTWLARVGPARLEEQGLAADRCITHVLVSYQDVDGTQKYVGPVGSGADTESATLEDTDTQNPAVAAGLERWATLSMDTSTPAGAIQVGSRFLDEFKLVNHSGRAELVGWVMDDKGVTHPYSSVTAGDSIVFLDAADTSPRRIVKTSKNHSSRAVAVDLDAPPEGTQALLERLGVGLVNLSAVGAPAVVPPKRDPTQYYPASSFPGPPATGIPI